MDILNSNWLVQMLTKAEKSPQMRLLSLFDILDDWTEAPGISEQCKTIEPSDAAALKAYLSLEAAKAGAALPEMLATQLHMMAISAMQEKLIGHNQAALRHAKSAAEALITAQTKKEFHIARSSVYAIVASFIGALIIGGGLFFLYKSSLDPAPQMTAATQESVFKPTASVASPQSTTALIKQIEQMRSGNCCLLEAVQLPDAEKSVYFKNIILGQISIDPREQKLARELLSKIRCTYTPMLMKKST